MQRPALILLPLCLALSSEAIAADRIPAGWEFCPAPESLPTFKSGLPRDVERASAPTDIAAGVLQYTPQATVFSDDVELQRADQWLGADAITFHHDSERFITQGQVRYQDQTMRLTASQAEGSQKADRIALHDIRYQLNQDNGNGQADSAVISQERGELNQASYSTCPPGQRQWEFRANNITLDQQRGTGSAVNAQLRIGGVPVLWLPYAQFPTDNRRRTGLLMPKLGYDHNNGLDLTLPIYLNLAPNYDATLKPRLLSDRGLMLGTEFRYLFSGHRGQVEVNWLGNDKLTSRDRHLLKLTHTSRLSDHWHVAANLSDVSDVRYFRDFGESSALTSVTLLGSDVGIYGRGLGWTASLTAERWQIASPLLPTGSEPYRRLPRARLSWEQPLFGDLLESGITSEMVRFEHESRAGAGRVDLRPYLRAPLGGSYWFLTPEIAWRYTGYDLDNPLVGPSGNRNPSRSLPIASLDAGLVFERTLQWGDRAFLQTLEPRLYYLNVPYRNQDELPLLDSQSLSFGWPGLFRDNRFAGADRQGDANQATLALSSRLFDQRDGRERLSASLGRVFYFDAPRVTLPHEPAPSSQGSAYVAELNLALSDRWDVDLGQQWLPENRQTAISAIRSQWRYREGGLINAAYRYRAQLLEQTDVSFVVPVKAQWRIIGRWNYSLRDQRTLESMAGFEWKSCCIALRVLGRQYIRSFDAKKNLGLYLELELNGVGSFGRDTARLLDNAILGYSR